MPVQKDKGWEFTDLSKFDPDGCEPAGRRRPRRAARARGGRRRPTAPACCRSTAPPCAAGEVPDGVIVSTLGEAVAEHPELVEPHLGALVLDRDKFSAQNAATLARRRVRLRAARACASTTPIVAVGDPGDRRTRAALALADRGRGRAPRLTVVGAVPVGRGRPRGLLQPGHRAVRRRGRQRSSTSACRTSPSAAGSSAASARRSARDALAALGRPRPRLRPGQAADGDRHQRPRRRRRA